MASWLVRVWLHVKTNRILPGPDYMRKVTSEGTILLFPTRGGGGGAGGTQMKVVKFQSFGFAAEPTNLDVITADGLKVYLPPLLRYSVTKRSPYGIEVDYSQYVAQAPPQPPLQSRVATMAGINITQYITPQYEVGDELCIAQIGGLWRDLNVDARTFAGP